MGIAGALNPPAITTFQKVIGIKLLDKKDCFNLLNQIHYI